MRIAVLFQGVFPSSTGLGGGQRRVNDFCKSLSLVAEKVYMLVPNWNNKALPNLEEKYFDVKIINEDTRKCNFFLNKLGYPKGIYKFIKENSIDTVLFYNNSAELFFLKKKLMKEGYNVLYEQCDLPSSSNTGYYKYYLKLGEKYLPRHSTLNIAISEFLQADMKKQAPEVPTLTIPVLVDRAVFFNDEKLSNETKEKHGIKPNDIVISYAGGTWKDEGLKLLIEVFAQLIKSYKNLKLIIAGKLVQSSQHDDILSLVDEYQIKDNCITPGWLTTEEVKGVLSAADILVLPQLKNNFNVAGLPTKVAEYSSMGKAIVVSNIGDISLYFTDGENALLCTPSNFDSLYEKLEKLIQNKGLREKLGKKAEDVAELIFNFKNAGKSIIDKLNKSY
ncbi:MAG: glycosyltransferase family 4 protein [Saprospiraceae bacterium]